MNDVKKLIEMFELEKSMVETCITFLKSRAKDKYEDEFFEVIKEFNKVNRKLRDVAIKINKYAN